MAIGPLSDYHGYHAIWHLYKGEALPYRLLYPKDYNPAQSYPLLILVSGGAYVTGKVYNCELALGLPVTDAKYDNLSHITSYSYIITPYNPDAAGTYYDDAEFAAFVLIPQMTDRLALDPKTGWWPNVDTLDDYAAVYALTGGGVFDSRYAVRDLVKQLIAGTATLYNTDECTTEWTGLDDINVNASKVYMSGLSLGGGATCRMLIELRDVLAAVHVCGGYPYGEPYENNYSLISADVDHNVRAILPKMVLRSYHIPILASHGQSDGMRDSVNGLYECYVDTVKGGFEFHRCLNTGGHGPAEYTDAMSKTKFFDPTATGEQFWSDSDNGMTGMEWLFSKSKPGTPEDQYSDEIVDDVPDYKVGVLFNEHLTPSPTNKRVVFDMTSYENVALLQDQTPELSTVDYNWNYIESLDGGGHKVDGVECERMTFNELGPCRLLSRKEGFIELWRNKQYALL